MGTTGGSCILLTNDAASVTLDGSKTEFITVRRDLTLGQYVQVGGKIGNIMYLGKGRVSTAATQVFFRGTGGSGADNAG